MRILLKFSVAEAVLLTKRSGEDDEPDADDVGEAGADFEAAGWVESRVSIGGSSRETLRFWRRENLGMGTELGGGEFVYAGPAQSSEHEKSAIKAGSLWMKLAILEFFGADFG